MARRHLGEHEWGLAFDRLVTLRGDTVTSRGKLIPWRRLVFDEDVRIIPDDILILRKPTSEYDGESAKGKAAENVIVDMLSQTALMSLDRVDDLRRQHAGLDLVINGIPWQVKCDWKCGHCELGGTGNLYIETHECNPRGKP